MGGHTATQRNRTAIWRDPRRTIHVRGLRRQLEERLRVEAVPARPKWLSALLEKEVIRRILDDPRTGPGNFLGWSKMTVFSDVIGGGQANFDAPIGNLTGDDRALLYARYNQERHLDELGAAFTTLFSGASAAGKPTVLDLGCGPFTAGLALAAAVGADKEFRYYGIDKYQSMRTLGARFAAAARDLNGLHSGSTFWFGDNFDAADFGRIRGDLTIVVASYLLASPTLNVQELVAQIVAATARIGPGPVAVLYTNSAMAHANVKYPEFRDRLTAAGFEVIVDDVEKFVDTEKDPKLLRYALLLKAEQTTIVWGTPNT